MTGFLSDDGLCEQSEAIQRVGRFAFKWIASVALLLRDDGHCERREAIQIVSRFAFKWIATALLSLSKEEPSGVLTFRERWSDLSDRRDIKKLLFFYPPCPPYRRGDFALKERG